MALLQHQTQLLLINYHMISYSFFYQVSIEGFSNFGVIEFSDPVSVRALALQALETVQGWHKGMLPKGDIASSICELLVSHREMLAEYFSIIVTGNGELVGLPMMLSDYIPDMNFLPRFILGLGSHVEWEDELQCFEGIIEELAYLYTFRDCKENVIENSFSPMIKGILIGQEKMKSYIHVVADLPNLYKIFERC